ncbi:hypothetical protein [Methanobacterium petrolearium]|uniref:AbiTii domain-containing protein n=1 Tax=Methanobacterium petrolearium TaxID=710190 RepID=UPI001AE96FE6|nr:hypothetical protein [Methanobacterium petrolearium]MBP1946779.1 hypothetical protein [Methanobacterium petrolearium]BDZ69750.1 hypothetical protein GCM10025861_02670 [Methanobacterium petrolearium]
MPINDKILELIQEAFDDLENPEVPLSSVIRKTIRIANLINDEEAKKWLQLNLNTVKIDATKKPETIIEKYKISPIEADKYLTERIIHDYDSETLELKNEKELITLGIPGIENIIKVHNKLAKKNFRLELKMHFITDEFSSILLKNRNRIHEFLTNTERKLIYDQINFKIFDNNRKYVDSKLSLIAPDALNKFITAYKRINEKDIESRSQALLSCRRILKSVADNIYPPHEEFIKGTDGKERKLTDDKYINRILQFVTENSKGSAEKGLSIAEIEYLGNKLNKIDDLASKGVHSDVSEFEVNQCVIQTYLVIGDILHLTDNSSQ